MIRILSRLLTLPIALVGSTANGSIAIAAPVRIAQADCSGYGSNLEYKDCLRRNYEAADGDLNRVYRQVKAGREVKQRESLLVGAL